MPAAACSRDRPSPRRAEAAVPSRETPRLCSATALNGRAALQDGTRKAPGRPTDRLDPDAGELMAESVGLLGNYIYL